MEDNTQQVESMKTPKRSRRLSSKEFDHTSQGKRSTRKTLILQGVEEAENDNIPGVGSVTPSRSTKLIGTETPSQSNALATALTPRRSVRKSIKPVQEYENIIAQKGLCPKRAINYSLEGGEEEAAEGKWTPAVIGRVSAKRSKKARRAKKKQLQRQANILEAESVDIIDNVNQNQLNNHNEKKRVQKQSEINAEKMSEQIHSDEDKVEDLKDETKKSGLVGKDDEFKENILSSEKMSCKNENYKDVEPFCQSSSKYDPSNDQETGMDLKAEEEKVLQSAMPFTEVHKDENESLDSSMESGDIEMETMPVTADDCMESIVTPLSSPNKTANAPSTVGLADKDDDSDCIMLSFNDSLKEEQPGAELQVSEVFRELKPVEDICDYAENNMPTLLVCSDDDQDEEEVFVINIDSEDRNTEPVAIAEIENNTPLNRTYDAAESPTKYTESSFKQETPKQRPSITRIPTPFKLAKAVIRDKIIESQEELNEDDTPEFVMEPPQTKLKSSRKRSFSFCVDRPKKCVTFHSPANTTVAIFDGDLIQAVKDGANNVTERRKRSLSVTETEKEVVAYFKERKPFEGTPSKKSKLPEPSSKSKMPNFAAIHQMQFQRMESIADNVVRKAERAKVLSNSITKVKPTMIQKGLPIKNTVLRECNQSSSGHSKAKPKARQRIELSGIDQKPKAEVNSSLYSSMKYCSTSRQDLLELKDFSSKLSSKMSSSCFAFTGNTKHRLPKPRFDATLNTLKANIKSSANTTAAWVSHANPILPDSRPRFNTSTAIDRQPTLGGQKLDDRRKRHLDMYKSRSTSRTGDKKDEILRGVRTNRRFELQMMYRNRPN